MSKYNNFKIDTHIHTIASGHAYNTLDEMISAAKQKGMTTICITEHGPKLPGSCHEYYLNNYIVLKNNKDFLEDIKPLNILFGVEANIMDINGTIDIDLTEPMMDKALDIIIASIHNSCYDAEHMEDNTTAIINAMKNPRINIIGHPDDRDFDYEKIVPAALKYGKVLELNNSSNNPNGWRKGARERDIKMLTLCKEYGVPISLGSDAHSKYEIGNFSYIISILEEVDFPLELIINSSEANFKKYILKFDEVRIQHEDS